MRLKNQSPTISVVIACRNEKDHIEATIRSILDQQPAPGEFEIIVADGRSDDGTREVVETIAESEPRLKLVDNPREIVSSGLNAAICAARGDVIIRMDAHTRYASNYIHQCIEVLRETGADNVGGPACTESTNYMQSVISAAYHSPFSVGGARFHNIHYEGYVDTVTYGCWTRGVFDRFGLFDEELVRNQDDEFNLRLIRAGGKIWQSPRIRSWYRPRSSLQALFRQYMQYGYWKVRVIRKHKTPASWRHVVPGICLIVCLVLLVAAPWLSVAALGLLILIGAYAISALVASFVAAARYGWSLIVFLPAAFATFHFGYGWGFLKGVADFVVLRRKPAESSKTLTRSSQETLMP